MLRINGYFDECPYWKAFWASLIKLGLPDDGTVQIEDSHAEENRKQNFPSKGHSAAAKTQNTNPVEFAAHPAYRSNAVIMISAYNHRTDGYTDWPGRRSAHLQHREGPVIRISAAEFRSAWPGLCLLWIYQSAFSA